MGRRVGVAPFQLIRRRLGGIAEVGAEVRLKFLTMALDARP